MLFSAITNGCTNKGCYNSDKWKGFKLSTMLANIIETSIDIYYREYSQRIEGKRDTMEIWFFTRLDYYCHMIFLLANVLGHIPLADGGVHKQ